MCHFFNNTIKVDEEERKIELQWSVFFKFEDNKFIRKLSKKVFEFRKSY